MHTCSIKLTAVLRCDSQFTFDFDYYLTSHSRYCPFLFFFLFFKNMADPLLSAYIPATISKLAYTPNKRLENPVSARALLQAGKHRDGQHTDLDNGGLHTTYTQLYRSTISRPPGASGSHAEIVWRTTNDVFDAVTFSLLLCRQ